MELSFFVKGAAIGFSIAAPVGPIGILCIRRSLADGVWKGFSAGLGAATADAAFGCLAAFGLTAISGFLVAHEESRTWPVRPAPSLRSLPRYHRLAPASPDRI